MSSKDWFLCEGSCIELKTTVLDGRSCETENLTLSKIVNLEIYGGLQQENTCQ